MDFKNRILPGICQKDIRKDEVSHEYDGRIEFEIPAENIIALHEVEDSFPDMDRWLFDEAE